MDFHKREEFVHNERLRNTVKRRNRWLRQAFEVMDGQIRIIGDPESPAIIYNDAFVLSAYVKNFFLIFKDRPSGGKVNTTFELMEDFRLSREEIMHQIRIANHREVYRVQFLKSSLFLTGWNFIDRDKKEGKYPVFARINPKVYFTSERAEAIIIDLEALHYECFIV